MSSRLPMEVSHGMEQVWEAQYTLQRAQEEVWALLCVAAHGLLLCCAPCKRTIHTRPLRGLHTRSPLYDAVAVGAGDGGLL